MKNLYWKTIPSFEAPSTSFDFKSIDSHADTKRDFAIELINDDSDHTMTELSGHDVHLYQLFNNKVVTTTGIGYAGFSGNTTDKSKNNLLIYIQLPNIWHITKITCTTRPNDNTCYTFDYNNLTIYPNLDINYNYSGITGTVQSSNSNGSASNIDMTLFNGDMYCSGFVLEFRNVSQYFGLQNMQISGEMPVLGEDSGYIRKEEIPSESDIILANHVKTYVDKLNSISTSTNKSITIPTISPSTIITKSDIVALQTAINSLEANFANNCTVGISSACESCQEACTCQSSKCESCQDVCACQSSRCESCQEACSCQSCQSRRYHAQCDCHNCHDNDEE